ncbi:unnamed protein product [Rotaria sp. Silwood2]|nr:unnamed protein product [Rotaria sp. Silwood2]CAF2814507.1 unnamed protein product [Rotaria sp. Silwood2]CAF3085214.1 unnamed protein product [Rotaria sp. Silwood2]CAF3216978.1 unnamed protein product [Rotaria sp. Silwood2]CAF4155820.1 unnamed protein product [Rotaria sp. Silwood2]
MEHLTTQQKVDFAKQEFSMLVADRNTNRNQSVGYDVDPVREVNDTITRRQATLLINKVGFNVSSAELSDLIHDEDLHGKQFIETFDEQEINRRNYQLLKKIKKLTKNGTAINDQIYETLCAQMGVSVEDGDDDHDDDDGS